MNAIVPFKAEPKCEILPPLDDGNPFFVQRSPFTTAKECRLILPEGAPLSVYADAAMRELPAAYRPHLRLYIGEHEVQRSLWRVVRPKAGQSVTLRVLPAGGDGGKNLLRMVIMVAVVAVATWALGPGGGMAALGLSGLGATVATAVIVAGVAYVTQLALNALIPPPQQGKGSGEHRPFLTGGQNAWNPYGDIPRVFGKHRIYPVLAAHPYTELAGKKHYLRILLLCGFGPLRISDLRIGDTPLADFVGVDVEVNEGGPAGWAGNTPITLYNQQVLETPLAVTLDTGYSSAIQTSAADVTELGVDIQFPRGLIQYNKKGEQSVRIVDMHVEYCPTGTNAWQDASWWYDGDNTAQRSDGILRAGEAVQDVVHLNGRWKVPKGQYDVRVTRITAQGTQQPGGTNQIDNATWTVLRSVRDAAPVNQTGVCLIAIRIRASDQLQGMVQNINCIAESYLPVYSGGSWTYQISRNPAWAYADLLRRRGPDALIADNRIDIPALVDWAAASDAAPANAPGTAMWEFNGPLEGGSVIDGLRRVAAVGRANFTIRDGKFSVVRDVVQNTPIQHVTPRNSWSYSAVRTYAKLPHALKVRFMNAVKDWVEDEIYVYADGYSAANATVFDTLDLPGCTDAKMAWREGRYHLAVGYSRQEEHTFNMDIEALRAGLGDRIQLSHDVIVVGQAWGRVVGINADGSGITSLTFDQELTFETGKVYQLRIRHSDGTSSVRQVVPYGGTVPGTFNACTLASPEVVGTIALDDLFMFGETGLESAPMVIKKIVAGEDLSAKITVVPYNPAIQSADTGAIPTFTSFISNPVEPMRRQPAAPTFKLRADDSVIEVQADGTTGYRIAVDITPAGSSLVPCATWDVQWRDNNSSDWTAVPPVLNSQTTVYLAPVRPTATYAVRVRGVSPSGIPSDWVATTTVYVSGKTLAPEPPASASVVPMYRALRVRWVNPIDYDLWTVDVLHSTTNDVATATKIGTAPNMYFDHPNLDPGVAHYYWIVAVDLSGNKSSTLYAGTGTPLSFADYEGIGADGVLSREEKKVAVLEWSLIVTEESAIAAQATSLGVSSTTIDPYTAAYSALSGYLSGLSPAWNDTTQNTTIDRPTWNAKWKAYYDARQAILNAIDLAAAHAGATLGTNFYDVGGGLLTAPIKNSGITIGAGGDLQGGGGGAVTIPGLEASNGFYIQNSRIVISSGAITGIGSGAGTIVDNGAITIGADGQIHGAGGGSVTIGGLGYLGDLNATYGASAYNFTGTVGGGNRVKNSNMLGTTWNGGTIAAGFGVYDNDSNATGSTLVAGPDGNSLAMQVTFPSNASQKGIYLGNFGGIDNQNTFIPNTTQMVSWYAKATGAAVGHGMYITFNNSPTGGNTMIVNPVLTTGYQRYVARLVWGTTVDPQGFISIDGACGAGTIAITNVQVENGDVVTAYSPNPVARAGSNLFDGAGAVMNDATVKNSAVSIGADGGIVGAGGGAPTLAGLQSSFGTLIDNGAVGVDGSGRLTNGISTGGYVANSAITVSAGTINGIGAGAGSVVDNSYVLVNGAGQFSNGAGGSNPYVANTKMRIVAGKLTYNASNYLDNANIDNSQITMSPSGTINGAGGGTIDALQIANGPAQAGATNDKTITGRENLTDAPSYYIANYLNRVVAERKTQGYFFAASTVPNTSVYGILTTYVNDLAVAPTVQEFNTDDGRLFRRVATNSTTWGSWQRTYGESDRPKLGADLVDSGGVTLADNDVLNNTTNGTQGTGFVARPLGGDLSVATNATGAIKIELPQGYTNTMLKFDVEVFDYNLNASVTYTIAGYTYAGGSTWYNTSAQMIGADAQRRPVRFGFDSVTGKCCVWIGDPTSTWGYPKVKVLNVTTGHSSPSASLWSSGWVLSFDTAAATNVTNSVISPNAGEAKAGTNLLDSAGIGLGDSAIKNTSVSIGVDGGIVGAGGGAPTLAGLQGRFGTVLDNGAIGIDASGRFVNSVGTGNSTYISNQKMRIVSGKLTYDGGSYLDNTNIDNSQITMSPNGQIVGAGGGQVTPNGIGVANNATSGSNLLTDPVMLSRTTYYGAAALQVAPGNGPNPHDKYRVVCTADNSAAYWNGNGGTQGIAVTPGETVYFQHSIDCTPNVPGAQYAYVYWFDVDGNPCTTSASAVQSRNAAGPTNTWVSYACSFTVPPGAAYAQPFSYAYAATTWPTGAAVYFADPYFGRQQPGATLGSTAGSDLKDASGAIMYDATVKNTAISLNANGTINGAGGGGVTIGGLGYSGALDATKGADWSTNVSNIPYGSITKNYFPMEAWYAGSTMNMANIGLSANASAHTQVNQVVAVTGPGGTSELCLQMIAGTDGAGEGGFDWSGFNAARGFVPTEAYRYSIWVYRNAGATGSIYLGGHSDAGDWINPANGGHDTNPYFIATSVIPTGKWYLAVGIVQAPGSTNGDSGLSGVYDPDTGTRVVPGIDWRLSVGATYLNMRAYQYYASNNSTSYFARPLIERMTGTSPSIAQMMSATALLNKNQQWGDVNTRPSNLAVLTGSEPINNTGITINPNGTISGGGGGQATLSGMGAGALATKNTARLGGDIVDQESNVLTDFHVLNTIYENGAIRVSSPQGGAYNGGGPITGALRITLPTFKSSTMMQFKVDIFNYATGQTATYTIAGYPYDTGSGETWANISASCVVPNDGMALPVYFGNDGTHSCIQIGTVGQTWAYPVVRVYDFVGGYSNQYPALWQSGWNVTYTTTVLPVIADSVASPYAGNAKLGRNVIDSASYALSDGAVKNSAVSINSDGTLVGGGGGQVTAPGLGVSAGAGTSGLLYPIGSYTRVTGNTVGKYGGTHGAYQGGAVGTAQVGSAFLTCSIINAAVGGGWTTSISLDDDATTFTGGADQLYNATITVSPAGTAIWGLRTNSNAYFATGTYVGIGANSRMGLYYDGTGVALTIDGNILAAMKAPPGLKLFPKICDFYNNGDNGTPVTDVQYGAFTNNAAGSTLVMLPSGAYPPVVGANYVMASNSSVWGAYAASAQGTTSPCRVEGLVQPASMLGLTIKQTPDDPSTTYPSLRVAVYNQNGSAWDIRVAGGGQVAVLATPTSLAGTYLSNDTLWAIWFDGIAYHVSANGIEVTGWTSPAAPGSAHYAGVASANVNGALAASQIKFDLHADVTALSQISVSGPSSVIVSTDYLGNAASGVFPKPLLYHRLIGVTDVSTTTTWSILTQSGCTLSGIDSSGQAMLTGISAQSGGYFVVRNVRDGITNDYRCDVGQNRSAPPVNTSGTGGNPGTSGNCDVSGGASSTSYGSVSSSFSCVAGSAGQVALSAALDVQATGSAKASGSNNGYCKWQKSTDNSTWGDCSSEFASGSTTYNNLTGATTPSSINASVTVTGLTSGTTYYFRLAYREASTANSGTVTFSGTGSGTGS